MHWIVQDNLWAESGMDELMHVLQRMDVPFTPVSVLPYGTLSREPHPPGPAMAYGSVRLARIARSRGWEPGAFLGDNHRYGAWIAHWGREMLNADARISAFREVDPTGGRVFIRPAEDTKVFSGTVMDADEVQDWRDAMIRGERPPVKCSPEMTADTQVVCGPLAVIYKESRFFVVDGAVVAWSAYKRDGEALAGGEVDPVSLDYARTCVRTWQPARAFVLDTALTPGGPRIVEVNCINSAGFYGADVRSIVTAIEGMAPWAGR